jgi:hypothetical protein
MINVLLNSALDVPWYLLARRDSIWGITIYQLLLPMPAPPTTAPHFASQGQDGNIVYTELLKPGNTTRNDNRTRIEKTSVYSATTCTSINPLLLYNFSIHYTLQGAQKSFNQGTKNVEDMVEIPPFPKFLNGLGPKAQVFTGAASEQIRSSNCPSSDRHR